MYIPKEIAKYEGESPVPVIYYTKVRLLVHNQELFMMGKIDLREKFRIFDMITSDDEENTTVAEALIQEFAKR